MSSDTSDYLSLVPNTKYVKKKKKMYKKLKKWKYVKMQCIISDKRLKGKQKYDKRTGNRSVSEASSSGCAGNGCCHFWSLTLCHYSIWWKNMKEDLRIIKQDKLWSALLDFKACQKGHTSKVFSVVQHKTLFKNLHTWFISFYTDIMFGNLKIENKKINKNNNKKNWIHSEILD